ncbi:MAG: hypothetical protein FKY71_08160 [Spiribacter salinus]|uniref:Uncharacterized protein n=1 Tax=Spiribacter salinus TaxID=1335746 RepID=A0A540VS09_9GAMM|nr:MAG: hypothetical protein FKY71_08160 [Spiribacter salinus]
MTFYHASKQAAVDAGKRFEPYWHARAELEPHNGWVLVLTPSSPDVLKYPLHELLEVAELDIGRMRRKPDSYKKPPTTQQVKARTSAGEAVVAPPPPPPPPKAPA